MEQRTPLDDKLHWYKDAIIYELHIKAFRDGNGDGIGDFQGLLEKLDYLQELGVTAIWLLPFYPSPLKDDGYDIADYYSINPSYGNIRQFKQFLKEAHNRNLKVITELVINHTSDQHPWFQRARRAPKGSPERDFYVWTDDPAQYKDVRIIFQDYEASNWTWDPVAGQYYWHRFFFHQPDLNYDNPQVQEEVIKVLDYWCEMGVDGFRLDAVPYLFEREGTNGENLPETHEYLKKLRKYVDEKYPGTVFLAEANMWPEDSASYFGDGDECHMNYHFPVMPRMFMAVQMEDRYPITDIFDQTPAIPDTCQWAMFLRNHDELTLEMVTDEERDYMYRVYAQNPKARINLGIRHRLAPLMDNDRRRIELLNSLLFSLPGTPVLYYGDEIGMGDNVYLGDRDGVRTPMQWSPDRNAGFSITNPQRLYLPVILDPAYHYEAVNVETQRQNTSSLLWFTKRMINMRKNFKAFGRGDLTFLNVVNPRVLVFTRCYEDERLLIVVNLSKHTQPAQVDLDAYEGFQPIEAFSRNRFPPVQKGTPYFFTLGPYEYQWFILEKVYPTGDETRQLPSIRVNTRDDLMRQRNRGRLLRDVISGYLQTVGWFFGKERTVQEVSIRELAPIELEGQNVYMLLLEVAYESGLPELYFLPLAFVRDPIAASMAATCPESVLANLQIGEETGMLCDALYVKEFQRWLFTQLGGERLPLGTGELVFPAHDALTAHNQDYSETRARVHAWSGAYTAISFNNAFHLKVFRKVDRVVNPDLEITRFLSERTNFSFVPTYLGALEWQFEKETLQLGMVQELVENHGDGYLFMRQRINNYIERILARDRESIPVTLQGSLIEPVSFQDLPDDLKSLLGDTAAEEVRRLGERTGQLHLALETGTDLPEFKPEDFSLHYQRSLFAGMQSVVREAYQRMNRGLQTVPDSFRPELESLLTRKQDVLNTLKRIYTHKLEATKIRTQGNFHLGQILLTGRDVAIREFGGDPARANSDRRLKRSPLRDVAAMIRALHYVAYEGFLKTNQVQKDDMEALLPYARQWAHYMSQFFLRAYLETVEGSTFIPKDKSDLKVMLETYLLERAIADAGYEVANRPERALIPVRLISSLLG